MWRKQRTCVDEKLAETLRGVCVRLPRSTVNNINHGRVNYVISTSFGQKNRHAITQLAYINFLNTSKKSINDSFNICFSENLTQIKNTSNFSLSSPLVL